MQSHALDCASALDRSNVSGRIDAPLYSVLLELRAQHNASLATTMGHQVHALFLKLIERTDPALSVRLHEQPGYRPFTLSPLLGVKLMGDHALLKGGQAYRVRVTLLDGEYLWYCLSMPLLQEQAIEVRLGEAMLTLTRILSTAAADTTAWAGRTTWKDLTQVPFHQAITLSFASPTAFNMNGQYFSLLPDPLLVWDSLMRVWNSYAPEPLKIERQALREFITRHVVVTACDLSTHTLHFPKYKQKGFTGTCTYRLEKEDEYAVQFACLAAFARYSGVGYKTTMGMGQVRADLLETGTHERAKFAR